MKRVTGIGGIFFKARDPVALRAWYQKHLGIDVQDWGGTAFRWADSAGNPCRAPRSGPSPTPAATSSPRARLPSWSTTESPTCIRSLKRFGKFDWVIDPDGNKIELWEPPPGQ